MELKMQLTLRPGMPRETINENTLCLPVALATYRKLLRILEEKDAPHKTTSFNGQLFLGTTGGVLPFATSGASTVFGWI